MALTSKQVPQTLETAGAEPGTVHWQLQRRARRWRKYVPIALGMMMIVLMCVVAIMAPVLAISLFQLSLVALERGLAEVFNPRLRS